MKGFKPCGKTLGHGYSCGGGYGLCEDCRKQQRVLSALRGMVEAYELEAASDNPSLIEARAAYEEATGEKLVRPF